MPVNEQRKAIERRAGISKRQANRRANDGTATEQFESDKARKERATADLRERQAERAQIEIDKAKGLLIERGKVREDGIRIGSIITAKCSSCLNDWPSKLAGLNELQIREKLAAELDQFVSSIRDEIGKL